MENKTLIIAGCTRSGLTLMMQILYLGGYPCYGSWPAFEDYELGKIDYAEVSGKAIKVVDTQIQIPPAGEYYVIRLRRNLKQQSKSIIKFLRYIGIPVDKNIIHKLQKSFKKDYKIIDNWACKQKGFIIVNFEDLINNPKSVIDCLNDKYGLLLKPEAANCVIKRGTDCYDGMLETKLLNI